MSKRSAILAVVLSLGLMPAVGGAARANPRQYYGAWQQHPSKTYYYRS